MIEAKCAMCDQFLSIRLMGNAGHPLVCINPKCPDYFEPALRKEVPAPGYAKALADSTRDLTEKATAKMVGHLSELGAEPAADDHATHVRRHEEFKELFEEGAPPTEPARGHGIKLDTGKPPVYTEFLRQFPRAIRLVARVGEAGTKAPGHVRSGWKAVEQGYERYSDAFGRHILKEALLATMEEPDSGDPTADLIWEAATVAWNDLARLEHLIKQNQAATERIDGDPLA